MNNLMIPRLFSRFLGLTLMVATLTPLSAEEFPPAGQLPARTELPDPLTMLDGTKVTTAEQWTTRRRPELVRLIQHYMYGFAPESPGIVATVTKTDDSLFQGKCVLKEVSIRFRGLTAANAPEMHVALFLPKSSKPAPVFVSLNPCGNHTVTDHLAVTESPAWKAPGCAKHPRGADKDFWCVETLIERGYGFATYHESDIDPDQNDFTDGIHPHFPNLPGAKESQWATIRAWAWGLSRVADYLVTDPQVDATRLCVTGHSRRGKTALLAGALDDRFALVVPHQSGTGGAALSRDSQQETVERINKVFPHWFNGHFKEFSQQVDRLPFDQHCVIALIAPRPLLDTEGEKDKWANFPRSLDALKGADSVYKLLGKKGLQGTGLVEGADPIIGPNFGDLMQYRLDINHTLNREFWVKILDFADAHLKK